MIGERRVYMMIRNLGIVVIVLGFLALVIGGIFVGEGVQKNNLILGRMQVEKVTLALDPGNPQALTQINSAADAQRAADLISTHRRSIAPSYQALLGTGQFDPTNPKHLIYAQAMNLENYLYMAVIAFGLIQSTMASGAFMVITGIALGIIGLVLIRLNRELSRT
jgi:hypothetical protein